MLVEATATLYVVVIAGQPKMGKRVRVNLLVLLVILLVNPVIPIVLLVLLLFVVPAKFLNLKLNKMKKQLSLSRPLAGKLSLNKKTISNLTATEMSKHVGGSYWQSCRNYCNYPQKTKNGNTCPGHNTCYN
jgi:hypothetical protein